MLFKKLFSQRRSFRHIYALAHVQDGLEQVKKINGNLKLMDEGQFTARRLEHISGNLGIYTGARFFAKKLKKVNGKILVQSTDSLRLESLESAKLVQLDGVMYIYLPKLKNSTIHINKDTIPHELIVHPTTQVIYGDYGLGDQRMQQTMDCMDKIYNGIIRQNQSKPR